MVNAFLKQIMLQNIFNIDQFLLFYIDWIVKIIQMSAIAWCILAK